MESRKQSYLKQPSRRQKRIVRTQNAKVASFLREEFALEPFAISRDKLNRIVIIAADSKEKKLVALLLGTDKNGAPKLLPVGKLFFSREKEGSLYIPTFKVVNRFKGSGVGTILLRAAENYAAESGYRQITLLSELSASKIKSACIENGETDAGEGLKYLTYPSGKMKARFEGYFDKNLYFYFSNGFVQMDDPCLAYDLRDSIPLIKRHLKPTELEFGVRGKKYLFRPTDPRFKITTMHIEMDYTSEQSVHFEGKEAENSFVPLCCSASEDATQSLEQFLSDAAMKLQKSQYII